MSSDQINPRSYIPVISLVFAIALCAAYYFFMVKDAELMQQALINYDEQTLLPTEKPLYRDYIQRRLRIEERGSTHYLNQFNELVKKKNTAEIVTMILSDRTFYPYLLAEGRLFMSPTEYQQWKNKREQFIEPLVSILSTQKFSLIPGQFGLSKLLSHVFVEQNAYRLVGNIILLLLLASSLERRIGKGKILLLFISVGFFSSGTLSLTASMPMAAENSFQGATGIILGLLGMVVSIQLAPVKSNDTQRISSTLSFRRYAPLVGMVVLILGKIVAEWWYGLISLSFVLPYTVAFFTGLALHFAFRRSEILSSTGSSEEFPETGGRPWEFRVGHAKVMDSVSKLEFDTARNSLAALMKDYPNSIELVEQRYHLEKLEPDGDVYWDCARELIDFSLRQQDYFRMKTLFEDIQKNAASKQNAKARLAPEYYHKMMMVFVGHDDLNKAEQVFLFLELAGHSNIIKDACLLLEEEFKNRGMLEKEQQYKMLFERY